ncbi:MAG: hypothetical protein ABIO05_01535 [Ferruginibacter sp.]
MRFYLSVLVFFFLPQLRAQVTVSGTVYDVSKKNLVENVRVISTGGLFAITDSLGRYNILVNTDDSVYFSYNNKPTQKFAVKTITYPTQFDISIRVPVQSKYRVLEEVKVFSKTYKQDSLENRQTYADVFDYKKPGIESSISPGGVAGADLGQLINIFRFRRNKQLRAFQQRLEFQEQEKYISYRFNKFYVKKITGFTEPALDSFMRWYRPSYEIAKNSDEISFAQYIIDAAERYKKLQSLSPAKHEEL